MLIDLKFAGKNIMVVGGGLESYRKTKNFIDSGARIWVVSKEFSSEIKKLGKEKKVALIKTQIKDTNSFFCNLNPKPDVLLAVTDDPKLNFKLVKAAKPFGCLVYSVDNQNISDFILPAVSKVGDIKIAISTSGLSPAMARVLRERIEKIITQEDLLEVKLQAIVRSILKEKVSDSKVRSKKLYEILNNEYIKKALRDGKLEVAEEMALKLIEEEQE